MLTVFLKWSVDKTKNREDVIRNLLEKNVEVIVINNENLDPYVSINEDISVPKYEFFGTYNQLKEYCSQLTLNELFLIWEEDQDIPIEKILRKIENGEPCIYSCNYEFALNNGGSYVKKLPLIFTKDEGAEEKFLEGVFVLDKSLVDVDLDKIEDILWRLFDIGDISMIGNFLTIVKNKNNYLLEKKFYESAEKIKQFFLYEEVIEMDRSLMELGHVEEDYRKYLALKVGLLERVDTEGIEYYAGIFKIENLYAAYILKYLMENQLIDEFIKIARIVNLEVLKVYLAYLLSNFEDFYRTFYKFMIAVDAIKEISIKNNPRVEVLKELAKTYIVSMSDKSHDIEKKQMLVQMFVDYCNYGIYTTNKVLKSVPKYLNQEAKFIIEIDKAIGNINSNKIEQAIENLQNAAKIYPPMEQAVLYYVERLRLENQVKKYKLSICMIVRDEEKYLRRCLESLKPLVQSGLAELIIVDTGSKDNTINIAKEYTDKVYLHPWQGSFSEARNYSISLAQGEYIFIIDADEELEEGGAQRLIEFFNSEGYKEYNTYTLKIKNFIDPELTKYGINTQSLIFKNDGSFYYTGSIHNQPVYKHPVKHLDIFVLHYGYLMVDDEVRERKFKRTATLLKKELAKDPNNIYYRFQLSVSYGMYGNEKEALRHVKQYMKRLDKKESVQSSELMFYANAARIYLRNLLYDEVIKVCDRALNIQQDFIDLIFYKAVALFKKEEYKSAVEFLEKYLYLLGNNFLELEIASNDSLVFYTLSSKNEALKMLITSYYNLHYFEKCMECASDIEDMGLLLEMAPIFIECSFKTKMFKELAEIYRRIIDDLKGQIGARESFIFLLNENLKKSLPEEARKCLKVFESLDIEDDFIDLLKVNKFFKNNLSEGVLDAFLGGICRSEINKINDIQLLQKYKNALRFILTGTFSDKILPEEKILNCLDAYINTLCELVEKRKEDLLTQKELLFLNSMLDALEELGKGDIKKALGHIKSAVVNYEEMSKPIKIFMAKAFRIV